MVREGLSVRSQSGRSRQVQFLALGACGLLVVTCILSLGHKAEVGHAAAGSAWTGREDRGLQSAGDTTQQGGFLPNLVSATRSTLDSAWGSANRGRSAGGSPPSYLVGGNTLILYLYQPTDRIQQSNFRYFLRWGLKDAAGLEYLIVVQNQTAHGLPALPENARYWTTNPPDCVYGLGAIGKALQAGEIDREKYSFFIFTGSGVRGPLLPKYAQGLQHWTQHYLAMLQGPVKLAGSTISCQDPEYAVNATGPYFLAPYVQFTTMITDQVGFKLMEKEDTVFECYNETKAARFMSERGAGRAMLKAGYTLDSFLLRYRGVDWTNRTNWDCNARMDPTKEWRYDGITINPFEVMFVPMDLIAVQNGYTYAKQAAVYDSWFSLQDSRRMEVLSNFWEHDSMPIKRQRIAYVKTRGPGCFDHKYYLKQNPDLFVIPTPLQLWDHFVMNGQFEGRNFRWSCEDDRRLPWEL